MMEINVSWYLVDDLEASKKFYGEALGLKKVFEMDGWCEFGQAEGAPTIGLNQRRDDDPERGATVVLRVENLEESTKRLKAKGVKFEGEVMEVPGVVRIATFRDPSGNRLQLCQVIM